MFLHSKVVREVAYRRRHNIPDYARLGLECEPQGCGISWLYWTGEEDPFFECCVWHDLQYDYLEPCDSTAQIDCAFYECCLEQSDSWYLRRRAAVYYGFARAWGIFRKWRMCNGDND